MKLKSKLFAGAVAFTMVLSAVAMPVSAQTTAELTAQINSLLAMIAQLQAQIAGGTTTGGSSMVFTSNLTIGSKGAEVTALQTWLSSKGYLVMPAGVAMGYFGPLTQGALAKYQAEAGISPAAGYFGPITRAKLNAMGGTTGGTTTGGTTGISTPGVEGTLSVDQNNSGVASTIYEGDDMVAVLGFDVEAKNSDIAIQRIKLDMDESTGSDTKFYNKIFKKLYVTEGSNVLASVDLNSGTVVKDGSDYFITLAGFNLVVPKNSKKQIVIKADVYENIDSTDYDSETYSLSLASTNAVRGVDGAGIDQYAGTSSVTKSPTISATLADSATLTVSLNSASPKKNDIVATGGSNENEKDDVTLLVFDVKAEKDAVTITDLSVGIWKTGSGAATASTSVSIFDGSTELDSDTMASGDTSATFSDLDYVVPKDTTKTLTVKVDVRAANGTVANFVASTTAAMITSENARGDAVTESGSATGYQIGVRNQGLEITLVSKSITTSGVPQGNGATSTASYSTSTLVVNYSFKVKAIGNSVQLGLTQATTSPFVSSSTSFDLYRNGSVVTDVGSNSTSTSFTVDSICTTSGLTNSCSLAEGAEVTIPVSWQIQGRNVPSTGHTIGLYAVGINALYGAGVTYNFMDNETDWRTADVSFP